jgi:hypothetical protein
MTLQEIIDQLGLVRLTDEKNFDEVIPGKGYTSDLLSCVMAGASHQSLWITLQAHSNIIAIAALLDLSAIIITEGAQPDEVTVAKANEQNVILLSTSENTFTVVGKLWELGIRGD